MNAAPLIESRLEPRRLLGQEHDRADSGKYRLGFPGLNPSRPSLDLLLFDNSGSIIGVGGNDPLGNRFDEAWRAIRLVAQFANDTAKVGLLSFDHPAGFVAPQLINLRAHRMRLRAHLGIPLGGSGSSELLPSLSAAEKIVAAHPGHSVRLTVLSDFELLDADPAAVFDRLRSFPGTVHAVVLGGRAPLELHGRNIVITEIQYRDAPGSLATAVHTSLTATRPGRRSGSVRVNTHPSIPPLSPASGGAV